jgi:VWFA-related protein
MSRKRYPLRLLAALAAASNVFSQTPPAADGGKPGQAVAPTIKVETRVVLVDVVVTDHRGATVSDLRQEDFQVLEDGQPRAISAFEEHQRSASAPLDLPPLPPHVYTNQQSVRPGDSVNVLLIDMLNTQPWSQKDVCNQAIKFVATLPAGTRLAIFTLNDQQLRLVRGFTTDFSGLAAALDGSDSRLMPESSWLNPTPSRHDTEMRGLSAMIMMQASPAGIEAVKQYLAQESAASAGARSDLTLEAFQHLARYLSGIPARKNVIWLADRFPISFIPQNKVKTPNHQLRVQQTSDMLTAAQVAIYPVSARPAWALPIRRIRGHATRNTQRAQLLADHDGDSRGGNRRPRVLQHQRPRRSHG